MTPENEMADLDWERDKFEYQMAQEMLRHYDSLNWQIGSILIAGTLVLTGLIFNKDTVRLLYERFWPTIATLLTANLVSYLVLLTWLLWFRRHRAYYNFRNEVFHRVELRRSMYHHLAIAQGDLLNHAGTPGAREKLERLEAGRKAAYGDFKPLYDLGKLPRPSGYTLAIVLAIGIPSFQLIGTLLLALLHHCKAL